MQSVRNSESVILKFWSTYHDLVGPSKRRRLASTFPPSTPASQSTEQDLNYSEQRVKETSTAISSCLNAMHLASRNHDRVEVHRQTNHISTLEGLKTKYVGLLKKKTADRARTSDLSLIARYKKEADAVIAKYGGNGVV